MGKKENGKEVRSEMQDVFPRTLYHCGFSHSSTKWTLISCNVVFLPLVLEHLGIRGDNITTFQNSVWTFIRVYVSVCMNASFHRKLLRKSGCETPSPDTIPVRNRFLPFKCPPILTEIGLSVFMAFSSLGPFRFHIRNKWGYAHSLEISTHSDNARVWLSVWLSQFSMLSRYSDGLDIL